jgi:predicted AAA+ superfamily ATPase
METRIKRHIASVAIDYLHHFPIVFIEGGRQVGKSTLAKALTDSDQDAVHVNFDDPVVLDAATENPSLFVEQSKTTLVIDEVQRYPEIFLGIKASLENDRRPGRFLLTGSVGLLQVPNNPESLAGRAVTLRLRGLSQGELMGVKEDFVSFLSQLDSPYPIRSALNRADYARLITTGGFPELRSKPDRIRRAWYRDYVERILEKDVGIFPRGTQPSRLKSVLSLLVANHSGELVYSRLANDLDVSMPSVKDSIIALERVFLVDKIPGWSPNLTKREIGRPKAFVSDSGLAAHLMGESEESLCDITSTGFGPLLEGFVTAELMKQQGWSREHFDIFHYRDFKGLEVDVVLVLEGGGVIGIEVKATSDPREAHTQGLKALKKRVGSAWRAGVILHTGHKGVAFGDGIFALPVSALWDIGD